MLVHTIIAALCVKKVNSPDIYLTNNKYSSRKANNHLQTMKHFLRCLSTVHEN